MSTDPALGEYISGSNVGNGGIYNTINFHVYHYAGNNPIKYTDPTGMYDDVSEACKNFIKDYEGGFREKIYDARDPKNKYESGKTLADGDWTIGYGHKLTAGELKSGTYDKGITQEGAESVFNTDLKNHIEGVNKNVSNAANLTQNQFDALVSASFNMGRTALADSKITEVVESFKNKISSPELINEDEFKIKIADAFRYHIPLAKPGSTNAGIKERRYNEYQMFVFGDYKRDPTPSKLIPWRAGTLP